MNTRILIIGDILAIALLTLIGFASHGELTVAFVPRMAAAFLPLLAGWLLLAPILSLYQENVTRSAGQLWRPAFVMLFAGPLATVVRGLLLNAPVIPIFAVVLTTTGAACLTIWRLAWMLLKRRRGA
jgi:DUF3054 family protein